MTVQQITRPTRVTRSKTHHRSVVGTVVCRSQNTFKCPPFIDIITTKEKGFLGVTGGYWVLAAGLLFITEPAPSQYPGKYTLYRLQQKLFMTQCYRMSAGCCPTS